MVASDSDDDVPLIVGGDAAEKKEEAIDLTQTPDRKKPDGGSAAKKEEKEFSDEDEEARFLALMNKHASPNYQLSKLTRAPDPAPVASTASPAKAPAKEPGGAKKKLEVEEGKEGMKGASAKSEVSKIKFSRSVPVMVPNLKRVIRNAFVLQCEDHALDFEGDSGVIGTLKTQEKDSTLQLDVKGQLFEGAILPCSTMMLMDVGATEMRVEAVMNDFVQLTAIANPHDENMDVDLSDEDDPLDDDDGDKPKGKGGKADKKGDKKAKKAKKPSKTKGIKKPASKKPPKKK
mmetsp:Transcript_20878/g.49663  ORF Transcript_20878/g.49663 Transcript_20878/m.49663 type:complete len:289 (+) Transcript_20878:17-883(+)